MSRENIFLIVFSLLSFYGMASHAQPAAQDFGQIANVLTVQSAIVTTLVTAFAFLMGVATAFFGVVKLKKHAENPNDSNSTPVVAFVFIFAGAAMVAIPSLILTGVVTFFRADGSISDAFGSGNVIPF